MGHKTVKRVPMDFAWPMGKLWEGYVNPYARECPACERGYSPAREILSKLVELLLLAGDDAVRGTKTHPYLRDLNLFAVSPDMVELTDGLVGGGPGILGYDGGAAHAVAQKIIKAAGLPKNWGICKHCGGSGEDPATKAASDAWTETEPPVGVGWQLWDTCSDGMPESPVFATAEKLAVWCERHAHTFGDFKATAAQWLTMFTTEGGVDRGTSLVGSGGRLGVAIDFEEKG